MALAQVTGTGAAADAVALALRALGWDVVIETGFVAGAVLLVTVPPPPAAVVPADRGELLARAVAGPMALAEGFAATQPQAGFDAAGALSSPAQVIHLIDRAALVPGCADPAHGTVAAALAAEVAAGALRLAPAVRVNGLAVLLDQPGDLLEPLRWLTGTASVSGQILPVGAPPRPSTAWRLP